MNETLKQLQIRHARIFKEQRELVLNMRKIIDSADGDLTDKAKRLVKLVLTFDKRCSWIDHLTKFCTAQELEEVQKRWDTMHAKKHSSPQ